MAQSAFRGLVRAVGILGEEVSSQRVGTRPGSSTAERLVGAPSTAPFQQVFIAQLLKDIVLTVDVRNVMLADVSADKRQEPARADVADSVDETEAATSVYGLRGHA